MTVSMLGPSGRIGRRQLGAVVAGAGAALAAPAASAQGLQAIRGQDGWLFAPWDNVQTVDVTNLPRVSEIISEAVRILRAGRVEVAIALIPAKAIVYRNMLPPGMTPVPAALRRYEAARSALMQGGASLVPDLMAPMAREAAARPEPRLFFRADTHWTPVGAELAAGVMAGAIRSAIRLPASPGPAERLGPPVRRTRGRNDLLEFIPAADRRNYPAEEYVIRAPAARTGSALIQEDRADVVAVGSSFLAPEFNFSSALSAELGRPVALDWKPANLGPYATLLTYLRSQMFQRQRPRLMVLSLLEGAMVLLPTNRSAFPQHAMSTDAFLDGVRAAVGG